MVSRIGDWYAFSRNGFCRTLPVCDESGDWSAAFSRSRFAAAAPLGGPIALVHPRAGPTALFDDVVDVTNFSMHAIPALTGAASPVAIKDVESVSIYSAAGTVLATCRVPTGVTGPIIHVSWTKAEDLCIVTARQVCLLYNLRTQQLGVPPVRLGGSAAPLLASARAFSLYSGADVPLAKLDVTTTVAAGGVPHGFVDLGAPPVVAVVGNAEGVVTLDDQRTLRAVLHGEHQSLHVLSPARLPGPASAATAPSSPVLAFGPPGSNDEGSMLVLWSWPAVARGEDRTSTISAAFWDDLPTCVAGKREVFPDSGDEGEDGYSDLDVYFGRDPEAMKLRAKLERRAHMERDKALKKKRKLQQQSVRGADATGVEAEATTVDSAWDTEKTAQIRVRGSVVALEVCPGQVDRVAACTDVGVLYVLASDLGRVLFSLDMRRPLSAKRTGRPGKGGGPGPQRTLQGLVWCSGRYVLLHLSDNAFAAATTQQQQQHYALLIPVYTGSAVRAERLEWGSGDAGALLFAAEPDGARVVTGGAGCHRVEAVPAALVALCRLQPPFDPPQEYLTAYCEYHRGSRDGLAQVRRALARHRASAAGILLCLLEAACAEADLGRQALLLSAASFALQAHPACLPYAAARLADAAARVRVMAALRAASAEAGRMPLSLGQYAVLAGFAQLHDPDDGGEEWLRGGGAGGFAALAGTLLLAPRPLTAQEGHVLVDRLIARRAFQAALLTARVYDIKVTRVLHEWAATKIWALGNAEGDKEEGEGSDGEAAEARALRDVRAVLSQFPEASYAGCAQAALSLGRPALALTLLKDEPPSGGKLLALVRMGRAREALRTATESADAGLLCLVLSALLSGCFASDAAATVGALLLPFPDILCCLAHGATLRRGWHQALLEVLLGAAPPPCLWWFVTAVAFRELSRGVEGRSNAEVRELQRAVAGDDGMVDDDDDDHSDDGDKAGKKTKRAKKAKQKSKPGDKGEDADDSIDLASDGGGRLEAVLPALFVPKPPLAATPLLLRDTELELVAGLLRKAAALAAQPNALPSLASVAKSAGGPRLALMRMVWGLEQLGTGPAEQQREAAMREAHGRDAVPALFPMHLSVDLWPFSALSPPSLSPADALALLARQARLQALQQDWAQAMGDPRFVCAAPSATDTLGLLAEHGAWEEAELLRREFPMSDTKFFLAKLLALCRAAKWEALGQLLGPPPPLVRGKGFFSSGSSLAPAAGGKAGGRAKPPPCGYEPVVDILLSHGRNDLAAEYVPGITTDPASRVEWYVTRIGAPVRALEAAFVGEDAGLLRQILERVPDNAKVQETGARMLVELEDGDD